MTRYRSLLARWLPAILWMAILFAASATPSRDIPSYGVFDFVVKKGGHMLGYAVLGLLLRRALGWEAGPGWLAWVLAVLYALTDEFHQSFVPGRHPSLVDALVFDAGGAAIALLISAWWAQRSHRQMDG